jgi:hypothetical protein
MATYIKGMRVFVWWFATGDIGLLGESRAIRHEHRSHATAAARRTHPARSNVDAADAPASDDECRPDSALQPALPRLCGFSATPRGNLYALELKASTVAARLVEFQVAVNGFGLQTLDLARLCHACTLPRRRRVRRRNARRCLRHAGGGASLRPVHSWPLVFRCLIWALHRARGCQLSH